MDGTHRISWDLADVTKSDVLPAVIDVVSATIRAKVGRGDEDGLGNHRLALRIGSTWWCGGTRGEIQGQEFDPISRLDRRTRIHPPTKEKEKNVNQTFFVLFFFFPFLLFTGKGRRKGEKGGGRAGGRAGVTVYTRMRVRVCVRVRVRALSSHLTCMYALLFLPLSPPRAHRARATRAWWWHATPF